MSVQVKYINGSYKNKATKYNHVKSLIATLAYLLKHELENLPYAQQVISSFVLSFIYLLGLAF